MFFQHGWSMGTIIGSARQILESLLSKTLERNSTHYVLATSMAEISVIITTKSMVLVSTDAAIPLFWLQATLLTLKTPYAMLQGTLKSSRIKKSTIPSGDEYKLFQIDFGLDGRENIYLPWRTDGRWQTLAQILNKETWCCSITNLNTEIICH